MPTPRPGATASSEEPARLVARPAETKFSRREPQSNTVPPQLLQSVPLCARRCLSNYINQDYKCSETGAACLCEHYSSQGYTLGELAYICLEQGCEKPKQAGAQAAYFICAAIPGAVSPKHDVLTVPPPTTTRQPNSRTTARATSTGQETEAAPPHTTSSPTSGGGVAGPSPSRRTKTHGPSVPSSTAVPGTPPPAPALSEASSEQLPSTNLSHAEAAGISIGAMGAIALIIAAIYLCIWFRRRRVKCSDDSNDYDFVDQAPPRFSPFNYGHADPRGPLGGFEKRRAELGVEKPWTKWPGVRMSYDDYVAQYNEKSPSITPPESRTVSNTKVNMAIPLPEKPLPAVTRGLPKSPAPSRNTAITVFEEDRTPRPPDVTTVPAVPRKPLPNGPPPGIAVHYPSPRTAQQRLHQPAAAPTRPQPQPQSQLQPPNRPRQPSLSLQIPRQATRAAQLSSANDFPMPPAYPNISAWIQPPAAPANSARTSTNSVLDYYASPVPDEPAGSYYDTSPDIDLPTPVQLEARRRRQERPIGPAVTVTKPAYLPARPSRMNSAGSDTSFESMNGDEPTPPDEEQMEAPQLTPVQESPGKRSPLAGLRYPKVPRSSNQSVPRSPAPKSSPRPATNASPTPRPTPKVQIPRRDDRVVLPSLNNVHGPANPPRPQVRPPVTPKQTTTAASNASLSGSTLAAKRRGDSAAQDLERKLHVTDSAYAHPPTGSSYATTQSSEPDSGKSLQSRSTQTTASPLKGYGRIAGGGVGRVRPPPPPQQAGLGLQNTSSNSDSSYSGSEPRQPQGRNATYPGLPRHPRALVDDASKNEAAGREKQVSGQWEPKLTPSRRGEDLFLDVGVATPRSDVFRR
ncbi:uncharacterized protein LTR77_005011 [Saxophila tyrrhenica]|uniref:CFEM domain-containing protein n=1 Tax=Saxophila tyrrhenica TaxID=1690608 RepID=A0AAV9PF27_9PEZI|nr:hypothetical protein LTR77_005011 [Saxophila tyrrhenica]